MNDFFLSSDFSEGDIAGLFGIEHIIYIAVTLLLVSLLLFLSRGVSERGFRRIHISLSLSVTVLEIIKIFLNISAGAPIDNWIPLYFCGLFTPALWLLCSKRRALRTAAISYITMGGVLAGIFFTFYPSTSLARYPALHPASIHAAFFHGAMIYLGLLILMRGLYIPKSSDLKYYFTFVTAAAVISLFINHRFGTNCMFLRDPFGLPILSALAEELPLLYILIVWLAQAFILFKISISLYKLFRKANKNAFSTH